MPTTYEQMGYEHNRETEQLVAAAVIASLTPVTPDACPSQPTLSTVPAHSMRCM